MPVRNAVSIRSAGASIVCFHCGWDAELIRDNIYYCGECFAYMRSYAHQMVHYWPGDETRVMHTVIDGGCYESEIQGGS